MSQTPHIDTDTLSAYLDDAVSAAERREIADHLADCALCRQELAELRGTVALLRGLPQYEPRRSFRLGAEQRLPRGLPVRLLPVIRPLSIAAVMLFAIVTGVAYVQDDPSSDLAPSSGSEPQAPADESAGRDEDQGTTRPAQTSLMTEATTAAGDAAGDAAAGADADQEAAAPQDAVQEAAAPQNAAEEERAMAAVEMADPSPTTVAGETVVVDSSRAPPAGQSRAEDERIDGWALASAGLGMAAAVLLVAWAVLARLSGRPRS
jgi:hypothetical protein